MKLAKVLLLFVWMIVGFLPAQSYASPRYSCTSEELGTGDQILEFDIYQNDTGSSWIQYSIYKPMLGTSFDGPAMRVILGKTLMSSGKANISKSYLSDEDPNLIDFEFSNKNTNFKGKVEINTAILLTAFKYFPDQIEQLHRASVSDNPGSFVIAGGGVAESHDKLICRDGKTLNPEDQAGHPTGVEDAPSAKAMMPAASTFHTRQGSANAIRAQKAD